MGWVMMSARKLLIQHRINNFEFKLMQLSEKLNELHKYSSCFADGYIDFGEMAGMPIGYLPMAMQYAGTAHLQALGYANMMTEMQTPQMVAAFQQQGIQLNDQQIMRNQAFMWEQAMKSMLNEKRKEEEAKIKVEEDEINNQMKRIETQLKVAQQEYQAAEKAEEQDIQRATPKYA